MDMPLRPEEIKKRARDAGISMRRVYMRAKVDAANWTRWKNGDSIPSLDTYERLMRALIEIETEMSRGLAAE